MKTALRSVSTALVLAAGTALPTLANAQTANPPEAAATNQVVNRIAEFAPYALLIVAAMVSIVIITSMFKRSA